MEFLFSQRVGPDIESHEWRKIFQSGEGVLLSQDVEECQGDLGSNAESHDGSNQIHMRLSAGNLFLKTLYLFQHTLIITSDCNPPRSDMSLGAKVFQCHQKGVDALQFCPVGIDQVIGALYCANARE